MNPLLWILLGAAIPMVLLCIRFWPIIVFVVLVLWNKLLSRPWDS